jgi:hypothetical protein
MKREAKVLQIVRTLGASCRFASGLNCRQQQRDEDPDDRDHHQQLHQRESISILSHDSNSHNLSKRYARDRDEIRPFTTRHDANRNIANLADTVSYSLDFFK